MIWIDIKTVILDYSFIILCNRSQNKNITKLRLYEFMVRLLFNNHNKMKNEVLKFLIPHMLKQGRKINEDKSILRIYEPKEISFTRE
ncbi:hypothetical protein [Anaerorhabdus sp.]|uniref:hypothetical protein n=1 Tax=Anaerorhabdus sp. TaxID=1872524 RepID=UPI002FC616D1